MKSHAVTRFLNFEGFRLLRIINFTTHSRIPAKQT